MNLDIIYDPHAPITLAEYEAMMNNSESSLMGPEREVIRKLDEEIEGFRYRKKIETDIKTRRDAHLAEKRSKILDTKSKPEENLDENGKAKALLSAQTFFAPKQPNLSMLSDYPQPMVAQISAQTTILSRQNKRNRTLKSNTGNS